MLDSPESFPNKTPLMAYGGRPLSVKGHCVVNVRVGDTQNKQLKLAVVNEEKGGNLFGLNWSDAFGFTARGMSQLDRHSADYKGKTDVLSCYTQAIAQERETSSEHRSKGSQLTSKFHSVFSSKLGCCTKFKVSLQ